MLGPEPIGILKIMKATLESPAADRSPSAGYAHHGSTAWEYRFVLQEEARSLPFGAVWDYYCESIGVPVGEAWLAEVKRHEHDVLAGRK